MTRSPEVREGSEGIVSCLSYWIPYCSEFDEAEIKLGRLVGSIAFTRFLTNCNLPHSLGLVAIME